MPEFAEFVDWHDKASLVARSSKGGGAQKPGGSSKKSRGRASTRSVAAEQKSAAKLSQDFIVLTDPEVLAWAFSCRYGGTVRQNPRCHRKHSRVRNGAS